MTLKTSPYDSANYLDSEDAIIAYLDDALESGDPALIAHTLGVVARARSMSQVAQDTGLSREALYRTLSSEGNPELGTVLRVMKALGLRLTVSSVPARL